MLAITDRKTFLGTQDLDNTRPDSLMYGLAMPALLFGSLGAITWAIRGTDGWGGIDGTLVPGLAWGLLWYYLCLRRGVDARGVALWLGLGLAMGGELGYGVYVSWIRGMFNTGEEIIPISPWVGYLWFALCGIGWAAPGGIVLGWALNANISVRAWSVRILLGAVLFIFIFNLPLPGLGAGTITWLGRQVAAYRPGLLFPHARLGLYAGDVSREIGRTMYTSTQNAAVVFWWLCALCAAAWQRDRATLVSGALLGAGFGVGFAVSAAWCVGYNHAPAYIDWWKMWELHAGFNLGLVYALLLYWVLGRTRAAQPCDTDASSPGFKHETAKTAFMGFSGFALVFAAGVEYFFWPGLLVALFYPCALLVATRLGGGRENPPLARELRKRVSLIYCAFLLVFMLCHGGVSRTGVFLGLYGVNDVDQYAWPAARILLFVPMADLLTIATLYVLGKAISVSGGTGGDGSLLPARMTDLFMFIGVIGAVSIWPEKIGVLYAVFLFLAMFAFTRINRRFDYADMKAQRR